MWRSDTGSTAINEDSTGLARGEKLFKFGDLDSSGSWGGTLTAKYRMSPLKALWLRGIYVGNLGGESELNFMVPSTGTIGDSSTTFSTNPRTGILTNNTLGGFTAFSASPSSRLWGIEASFEQVVSDAPGTRVSVFAGPRFIHFTDSVGMKFFEDPDDVTGADNETQTLSLRTTNDMYGAQVGAALEQQLTGTLFLTGSASIGLFGNHTDRARFFSEDQLGVIVINDNTSNTSVSWAAELGVGLSWRVAANASIDLGYRGTYLGNVETAAGEFANVTTAAATISNDSDVWIHGVRFGGTVGF
jgi:opacity protein-like surface antigen